MPEPVEDLEELPFEAEPLLPELEDEPPDDFPELLLEAEEEVEALL